MLSAGNAAAVRDCVQVTCTRTSHTLTLLQHARLGNGCDGQTGLEDSPPCHVAKKGKSFVAGGHDSVTVTLEPKGLGTCHFCVRPRRILALRC